MSNLILVAMLLSASAKDGDRLKLLVLDFQVRGTDLIEPATATAVVAKRVAPLPFFELTTQRDLANMINYAGLQQRLGIDDVDVLVDVGAKAKVDRIVYGTLAPVGSDLVVSLVLIDVASGEAELRLVRICSSPEKELVLQTLAAVADGLLAHLVRTYAGGPESPGRTWVKKAHPLAWVALGVGLGALGVNGTAHATGNLTGEDAVPGYAVGGAFGLTGLILALTKAGGERFERVPER